MKARQDEPAAAVSVTGLDSPHRPPGKPVQNRTASSALPHRDLGSMAIARKFCGLYFLDPPPAPKQILPDPEGFSHRALEEFGSKSQLSGG
jgi:hypothetical protein